MPSWVLEKSQAWFWLMALLCPSLHPLPALSLILCLLLTESHGPKVEEWFKALMKLTLS